MIKYVLMLSLITSSNLSAMDAREIEEVVSQDLSTLSLEELVALQTKGSAIMTSIQLRYTTGQGIVHSEARKQLNVLYGKDSVIDTAKEKHKKTIMADASADRPKDERVVCDPFQEATIDTND